jgi:uncharacterized repeat protein (TIGR01451 family)
MVPLIFLTLLMTISFYTSAIQGQRIESHVIASELDAQNRPIRFKTDFTKADPYVISWVQLRNVEKVYTCTWKWRDPENNLWREESKETAAGQATQWLFSYLPLEEKVFEKPGFWSVLFYIEGKYQFTDHFTVLSKEATTTLTTSTTVTTPAGTMPTQTTAQGGAIISTAGLRTMPEEGTPLYPGDHLTLIITLRNEGASAGTVELNSQTPSGVELISAPPPTEIKAGETRDFAFEFLCKNPGTYTAQVTATLEGVPLEGVITLRIAVAEPNVEIRLVEMKTTPEKGVAIHPGDYVTFTISLKNEGTTPAKTVELKPILPEGIELVEASPPTEIKAGETKDFKVKLLCREAGKYTVPFRLIVMGETVDAGQSAISVTSTATVEWPIIVGVVIVAVVIGVLVFYKRKGAHRITVPKVAVKKVEVEKKPSAKPVERKPPEAIEGYCIHCGAPIGESDKFCGRCGKPQNG